MVGIAGGCLSIEPKVAGGDSVIRLPQNISESVEFPTPKSLTQSITQSVTIVIT